jgi:hypothetical protein
MGRIVLSLGWSDSLPLEASRAIFGDGLRFEIIHLDLNRHNGQKVLAGTRQPDLGTTRDRVGGPLTAHIEEEAGHRNGWLSA